MLNRLLIFLFLILTTIVVAQPIRSKDKYGRVVAYLDGSTFRDSVHQPLYFFDGQTIYKKNKSGQKLFFFDGKFIRVKDKYGKKLYYFNTNIINDGGPSGDILYYIGNGYIKKTKYGYPIYFFNGNLPKWVFICLII